jgi:hypothetical protein
LGPATGLTFELASAGLGHRSTQNSSLTPFPENAPATAIHRLGERILQIGLLADIALSQGPIRPSLLAGAAWSEVRRSSQELLVDTMGNRIQNHRSTSHDTRAVLMFGLAVGFRPVSGIRPSLEARYHAIPILDDYGWSQQEFLTLRLLLTL